MIEAIPAMDLMDGQCVRLRQGDFEDKTRYAIDPVEWAQEVEASGHDRMHVVDLDGARSGMPENMEVLRQICSRTRLKVQCGGGIRTLTAAQELLGLGVSQVILGSLAARSPQTVLEWSAALGAERIIIGADLREGKVMVDGWEKGLDMPFNAWVRDFVDAGILSVLCTDVLKDGMMSGPSTEMYRRMKTDIPDLRLIASGGVSSIHDIRDLEAAGIDAVVVGKALYEGAISLDDLLQLKQEQC